MKQISENIWEFDPQIYPQYLWIAISPTEEEIKKFSYSGSGNELEFNKEKAYATVYHVRQKDDQDTGPLIIFKDKESLSFDIVAHESLHVASFIADICNLKYDYENDEHFAYLIGWVAECCEKVKKEYDNRS